MKKLLDYAFVAWELKIGVFFKMVKLPERVFIPAFDYEGVRKMP